jgi:hypothetical protein
MPQQNHLAELGFAVLVNHGISPDAFPMNEGYKLFCEAFSQDSYFI